VKCTACEHVGVHATPSSNQIFYLMGPWNSSWNVQLANMFPQPFVVFWSRWWWLFFCIDITLFWRTLVRFLGGQTIWNCNSVPVYVTFLSMNVRVC